MGIRGGAHRRGFKTRSTLKKCEQLLVDLVLHCRAHTVGSAFPNLQGGTLDDLRRQQRRGGDWHNLVVVAVKYQRWNVEFLEILCEVRLGERLDTKVRRWEASHHSLQPE